MRLIFDTNTLVSRLLVPGSVPAKAVSKGLHEGHVLVSDNTLFELADVLSREKFDKYISIEERQDFLRRLSHLSEKISIIKIIRECRDPKDDKFLELAVNGRADFLISGDADLLSLKTFRKTRILSPGEFLNV